MTCIMCQGQVREEARAEMLREPLDFFCSERVSAVSQVRPVLVRIWESVGWPSRESRCSLSMCNKDGPIVVERCSILPHAI